MGVPCFAEKPDSRAKSELRVGAVAPVGAHEVCIVNVQDGGKDAKMREKRAQGARERKSRERQEPQGRKKMESSREKRKKGLV